MSNKLHCPCGRRIKVPPDLTAKRIRCPTCQTLVEVLGAAETPETDMYVAEKVQKCPGCRKQWPEGTAVCIESGHDFRSGKKLKTTYDLTDRYVDIGVPSLGCYLRFALRRERKGRLSLIMKTRFLWIPLGTKTVDLKDYDSVATDYQLGCRGDGQAQDWYSLELQGPRKSSCLIWQGHDETMMHAVVDFLKQGAGLTIKRK